MPWSDRQQAMLAAMGLRVWAPPERAQAAGDVGDVALAEDAAAEALSAASAVPAAPATAAAPIAARAVTARAAGAVVREPSVPRGELATLQWPELRHAVEGCTACTLSGSRTQTVFGVGHPQAHWMVVGEAPGEQEDLQGEPFVGPSGELLDRMLAALRLTRSEDGPEPPSQRVYIANTLKCRPPRNRNPTPEEMVKCEPYLVRQIQLVKPRIILAMGAFAVRALLRSDQPVGKLRGQVHRYEGVPLVVTYHPAYLLRSLGEKAKAWEDLCLAAQVVSESAVQ